MQNNPNHNNAIEPIQPKFDWSQCEWGCRKVTVTYFDLLILVIIAFMNLSSGWLIAIGNGPEVSTATALAITFNMACFVLMICHVPFMCKRKFRIEFRMNDISSQLHCPAHEILDQWHSKRIARLERSSVQEPPMTQHQLEAAYAISMHDVKLNTDQSQFQSHPGSASQSSEFETVEMSVHFS